MLEHECERSKYQVLALPYFIKNNFDKFIAGGGRGWGWFFWSKDCRMLPEYSF